MNLSNGLRRVAVCVAAAILSGCHTGRPAPLPEAGGKPALAPAASGWPRTLTDDSGSVLTLPAPPRRIVSLAPSNTEILFALGAGDRVVADTESCDYPPEAKSRPHVGGLSAGDLEKIQVLFPDLVVAVGSINQKLVAALRTAHIQTLVIQPRRTEDVVRSMRLLGTAIGKEAEADTLAAAFTKRIERVGAIASKAARRPATLIVYSSGPIYTSPPDSFIHDLIGVAGGTDIVDKPLPENIISPAVVVERAPEVIICSPSLRTRLKALPGWGVVPAVKMDRFFSSSGSAELTRPGPRLALAVEQLAAYLHPELFPASTSHAPH